MKIKAHSATIFNSERVKGVSMGRAIRTVFGELAMSRFAGGEASRARRAGPNIGGGGRSSSYNVKYAELIVWAAVKGGDVGTPVLVLRKRTDDGER